MGGQMNGIIIGRLFAIALMLSASSWCHAQSGTLNLVPYPCQHKSSDQVTALLRPLLPADEPSIQLVSDRDLNRVLVAGPAYVHRIVEALVAEVDHPVAVTTAGEMASDLPRMQAYPLPSEQHPIVVADLNSRFGNQVRISSDRANGKLFVTATGTIHQSLANFIAQSVPTGSRTAQPRVAPDTLVADSPPNQYSRFVRVPNGSFDRIQNQLLALFSTNLSIRSVGGRQIYLLQIGEKPTSKIELEFDAARNGILVGGTGAPAAELLSLVDRLARTVSTDRKIKVLRLRRSRHQKLRSVLEGSSVQHTPKVPDQNLPLAGPKNLAFTPTIQRFPESLDETQSNIRLVRYLFQDVDSSETQSTEATPVPILPRPASTIPGRQFEGVDVESLPELDVIILRGTDQDLDQLADIVEQLESISEQSQPDIRIFPLQHAQSQAVSAILAQVSDELVGGRQGRVSTLALVKPNAILIVGWGDAVTATEQLLRQLDQPVAPESQSRVYRLKYAAAATVQQTLQTFYNNRGGLGPQIQTAIDARTNSLIVYAAPRDQQEVQSLIAEVDHPEGEAVNRARVIPIKNALAVDVAETLQQAIQAALNDGDRTASVELETFDATGREILRSGTLQNVQITPNPRNNTLIVSSPIENLELVTELIRQLDTPTGTAKIKVFRIANGDATALIQTLRSLIPSQGGGTTNISQLSATGEAGLAALRFSVDLRSNSIIATGSEGDLRIVEALLAKLDQSTSMQRKTAVYRLKNSPAIDVANAVNQYLLSRRQLESAVPGQANPFSEIEREVVVVPEPIANKLILAATPRYFDDIKQLIEKLDESPPQVMIQVLIAEVALNNADEFGVELGLQDSVLFDRSLLGDLLTTSVTEQTSTAAGIVTTTQDIVQAATNIPGFGFNSAQPLGNSGSANSLANAADVGGQAISNFAVGRTNDQLGFGGLVLSASSKNVSVLLRALRENRRVDVLSRPQIRTLDNQPAFIQVGQRVPRIIGSTVNQNGQSNSVALENVGLILGVTPRVSPDGTVVMEIDAEKSSLGPEQDGIPVAVSVDGTVIRSPRVDTTTAQATVSATDGETIVLGGLITDSGQYVHRSVPILGNIPILEHLFRFDSQIKRRSELLIILTPHVIRTKEDNERIRQLEMARMSWCACDVFELMDDMGYYPEQTYDQVDAGAPPVIYPDLNPTGEIEALLPPEPIGHGELNTPNAVNLYAPLNNLPTNTRVGP